MNKELRITQLYVSDVLNWKKFKDRKEKRRETTGTLREKEEETLASKGSGYNWRQWSVC